MLENPFWCKFLYFITDLIMFVYNNLLILMAIDRFLFICTNIRFKISYFMSMFHFVSFLIGSSSFARMLANNCNNIGFKLLIIDSREFTCADSKNFNRTNWVFRENLIVIYNYFIMFVISVNWLVTIVIYTFLIRFVYNNSLEKRVCQKSNPSMPLNLKTGFSNDEKEVTNSLILNSESVEQKTDFTKIKYKVFNPYLKFSVRNKIFKNSKHWKITKTFIKVEFIVYKFKNNYLTGDLYLKKVKFIFKI